MNNRIFNEGQKKNYRKYADKHAPSSALAKNCVIAFLSGGVVCVLGQAIGDLSRQLGVSEENTRAVIPVCLIFIACLLTGIGVFDKLASTCKAGLLVPITGFANGVCSSAMDSKSEGFVMGVGAKMFTIAGPVIVYGLVASVIYGIIYYITAML